VTARVPTILHPAEHLRLLTHAGSPAQGCLTCTRTSLQLAVVVVVTLQPAGTTHAV
jgi:hypothetical protein